MKKIFISHPYSDNPELNLKRVDYICKKLVREENIIPISPLHLFSFYDEEPKYREKILEVCFDLESISDGGYYYMYGKEENNYDKLSSGQKQEYDFSFAVEKSFIREFRKPPQECLDMEVGG